MHLQYFQTEIDCALSFRKQITCQEGERNFLWGTMSHQKRQRHSPDMCSRKSQLWYTNRLYFFLVNFWVLLYLRLILCLMNSSTNKYEKSLCHFENIACSVWRWSGFIRSGWYKIVQGYSKHHSRCVWRHTALHMHACKPPLPKHNSDICNITSNISK